MHLLFVSAPLIIRQLIFTERIQKAYSHKINRLLTINMEHFDKRKPVQFTMLQKARYVVGLIVFQYSIVKQPSFCAKMESYLRSKPTTRPLLVYRPLLLLLSNNLKYFNSNNLKYFNSWNLDRLTTKVIETRGAKNIY